MFHPPDCIQRVVYTINDGWKFTKGSPFEAQLAGCDDSSWETVNIPHTCAGSMHRYPLPSLSLRSLYYLYLH